MNEVVALEQKAPADRERLPTGRTVGLPAAHSVDEQLARAGCVRALPAGPILRLDRLQSRLAPETAHVAGRPMYCAAVPSVIGFEQRGQFGSGGPGGSRRSGAMGPSSSCQEVRAVKVLGWENGTKGSSTAAARANPPAPLVYSSPPHDQQLVGATAISPSPSTESAGDGGCLRVIPVRSVARRVL
jgi:hypothetical protein